MQYLSKLSIFFFKNQKSYISIFSMKSMLQHCCHMKRWSKVMKPKNVFLMLVVFVSFFKFLIHYDSFHIPNKCSFLSNLVFMISILLKNCVSFWPLKTCASPSVWLTVSLMTLFAWATSNSHTDHKPQCLSSPPGIRGLSLQLLFSQPGP